MSHTFCTTLACMPVWLFIYSSIRKNITFITNKNNDVSSVNLHVIRAIFSTSTKLWCRSVCVTPARRTSLLFPSACQQHRKQPHGNVILSSFLPGHHTWFWNCAILRTFNAWRDVFLALISYMFENSWGFWKVWEIVHRYWWTLKDFDEFNNSCNNTSWLKVS